ncbi:MAG: type II toxin-antitoxin system RelE/ParE family toxin [Verrucomicrobia bacterium]|jgi:plasmid stabilization system protein ParE|nr:type II toxin-antitoxin system RelE/ParE family toxin [Verrucomicrobiota bacterium]
MSGFALHPEAYGDIDDLRGYIAQYNPDAADRVIDEIFDAIRAVVPFPNRGHRRADLTARPLRFIRVRDYLIGYAPDEKPLWVVAVLHGRRNPEIMAAILRSRE